MPRIDVIAALGPTRDVVVQLPFLSFSPAIDLPLFLLFIRSQLPIDCHPLGESLVEEQTPLAHPTMFRYTARRLAVAAVKAAEPSSHTLAVSGAQGVARGLTGGL